MNKLIPILLLFVIAIGFSGAANATTYNSGGKIVYHSDYGKDVYKWYTILSGSYATNVVTKKSYIKNYKYDYYNGEYSYWGLEKTTTVKVTYHKVYSKVYGSLNIYQDGFNVLHQTGKTYTSHSLLYFATSKLSAAKTLAYYY